MTDKIQLPRVTKNQETNRLEPEAESLNQNQENQEAEASNFSADGAHIDDIDIEYDAGEGAEEPKGESAGLNPDGTMTRETFYIAFKGLFNISAGFTKLESLKVADNDQSAQMASDAIYDIASEVHYFRFLIMPSNVWLQRSICILAFLVPKCVAIKAELEIRKAKNVTPNQQQEKPKEKPQPKSEQEVYDHVMGGVG